MSQLLNRIKGSHNIITGCGSGLGKATLQWFLKHDSGPILAVDKKFEPDFVEQLQLTNKQKSNLMFRTHDTFNEKEAETSMSEFIDKYGKIDNLINVAGVAMAFLVYSSPSGSYKLEHAYNLFEFNTVGTFNMIRLAAKYMMHDASKIDRNSTKCIINTSCISTSDPSKGQSFYAGSKAAIDSMTLCLAREFSPFNIRCNTINVGFFDTKLIHSSDGRVHGYLSLSCCTPQRLGLPDEFAHLVHALIDNQMINGACIKIDAGVRSVHAIHQP